MKPTTCTEVSVLEACQCDTHLQDRPEGGPWELQACQPDLGARGDYGVIYPDCAHQTRAGPPGDQVQSATVHEKQILLNQRDLLL